MNNRRTSAKRKLLPKKVLAECYELQTLGVPLTKVIRDKELNITRSLLAKLLKYYKIIDDYGPGNAVIAVRKSLFPDWLVETKEQVQTNPDGWYYVGYFPKGQWHYDN
ncbi:hypothetical protein CL634_02110 [bacterium]|nr:hypothetical protein [bacterium]|tara:strand:- start:353 stop:676 length:324 start_codon:yes stop_codon:yes gene_type:complete